MTKTQQVLDQVGVVGTTTKDIHSVTGVDQSSIRRILYGAKARGTVNLTDGIWTKPTPEPVSDLAAAASENDGYFEDRY